MSTLQSPTSPEPFTHAIATPALSLPTPFPTIGQAVWITILLIPLQLVIGVCLGVLASLLKFRLSELPGPATVAIGNVLSFYIAFAIGLYWGKLPARGTLHLHPIPVKLLLPMAITVLGLSAVASEFDNLLRSVLPMPGFVARTFNELFGTDQNRWPVIATMTFVAPITEEPLFRGLLLGGLLLHKRPWTAIAVTALLFAAAHMNPWQFFGAFSAGLLCGWWFFRTRSLWPCLFGHALNNSLPSVLGSIPNFEIRGYTGSVSGAVEFQPLWFDLIGLVLFAAGILWTRRLFQTLPQPVIARPIGPLPSTAPKPAAVSDERIAASTDSGCREVARHVGTEQHGSLAALKSPSPPFTK